MYSVLFVSLMNSAPWGGSEELWYQVALYLRSKKIKVGVCCYAWDGKEEKILQLKNAGCDVWELPGRKETKTILGWLRLQKKSRDIAFDMFSYCIVNQGGWKDVVHGPFKKIYKKIPSYSLLYHNYDTTDTLSSKKKELFYSWINKATANISAAARVFFEIQKSFAIEIPNQQLLYNPLTIPIPESATPFNTSPDGKLIFSMLAELDTDRKAQDLLIAGFANDKWRDRNFELNIYGRGKDFELMERLIIENNLSDKIFLRGFTDNVKNTLTNTHVLLQITHKDAMPIAVTEAMAVARPVIASNVGDMPEWVRDGENGWLTGDVSVNGISVVLEKAWQNKKQLEEMGKASFRIFHQKFPGNPIEHFLGLAGIPAASFQ